MRLFYRFLFIKKLSLKICLHILLSSASTTAIVMLLVGTSMAMRWVMAYENIPQNVAQALLALSDNKISNTNYY